MASVAFRPNRARQMLLTPGCDQTIERSFAASHAGKQIIDRNAALFRWKRFKCPLEGDTLQCHWWRPNLELVGRALDHACKILRPFPDWQTMHKMDSPHRYGADP
jgi:hypothetical protein